MTQPVEHTPIISAPSGVPAWTRWSAALLAVTLASLSIDGQTPPEPDAAGETGYPARAQAAPITGYAAPGNRGDVFLSPAESRLLALYHGSDGMPGIEGLTQNLGQSCVVTPLRTSLNACDEVAPFRILEREDLVLPPSVMFGGTLGDALEFSLETRGNMLSPFPFGQGVALRGVGFGGLATRVVLDGVPANDPYGGWVNWSAMPHDGVYRAEVITDAGAASWGDGSLGGVVQFFTDPPSGQLVARPASLVDGGRPDPNLTKQVVVGATQVNAVAGDFGTRGIEVVSSQPTRAGVLQLLSREFSTDGTTLVADGQRGPIDTAAWRWNDWIEARWRQLIGSHTILTASVSTYRGSESAGTPDQTGFQKGQSASISLASRVSQDFGWNASVYARQVGSSEVFSFVNAARTAETIGIDVLAAPATAAGGSWSGTWSGDDGSTTVAGIDVRFAKGSMREAIAPARRGLGGGGEQDDSGIYVMRDQALGSTLRMTIGGRISNWDDSEGQLKQADITTRAILVAEGFPHREGVEFSPEAGFLWRPSAAWSAHINGQQAFSRPTLADFYGTTAQFSTVTEGNPALRTEYNTGFEVGADYAFVGAEERKEHASGLSSPGLPKAFLVLGASLFTNEMRDAIGDVDIPGNALIYPVTKPLPPGYLAQQTANIDHSRIQGMALTARWNPVSSLRVEARWQFSDPTIVRDDAVPSLDHNQIAGVPRHTGYLSVEWRASEAWMLSARVREFGAQYQDEENRLRLGASAVADAGASFQLSAHAQLTLGVQNIGNARIEMEQNTVGIFYDGAPRTASAGIRLNW